MKRISLTLIAITALYCFAKAQNTLPSSGNVGIGTTNPIVPLQIQSNGGNSLVNEGLRIVNNYNSSGNNNPAILLSNDGTAANPLTSTFQNWALSAVVAGGENFSIIHKGGNNPLITPFYINGANGFIGIGTTSPDNKLSVVTNNTGGINIKGNSGSYQGSDFYIGRTTSNSTVGYSPCIQFNDQATNAGALIQSYQGQFQFFTAPPGTGWNESLRIAGNGYVGIGTTSPGSLLTLNNPTGAQLMLQNNGVSIAQLTVNSNSSTWNGGQGIALNMVATSADINLQTGNPAVTTFIVKNSGNVGIGTSNPDQKLTVNGTIHSSEVKVDTSIPIPDYVFEASYKLRDLPSLDAYLNKYHHLPEIPSAAQIQKNGLKLGEMNTLLLKKVEELTLYLIQKDKQVKVQQVEIDQLKQQKELITQQQKEIDDLKQKLNTLLETQNKTK